LDAIAEALQGFIRDDLGYWGLFILIVLESTMVPVPSLLVMPFAGYLAGTGAFSLPAILAINSAGALVGSGLSYWFGAAGGKPLLLKYGKYILVRPEDIEKTHTFFEKYGARTIFVARFLPVIRHIISIPAGIARMRLLPFFALTFAGATLWGGGLMVLGYQLGENWEGVVRTWKKFDLAIGVTFVVVMIYLAVRFIRNRRRTQRASHTGAPSERDVGS
jgi:membrane protein DedA with SNARE-associated domain